MIVIPLGIQVSRMESRLLLLLKAVFIPITTKAFFLGTLSWEDTIRSGKLSRLSDLWEVRVADSSIWSVEIVLSNDLQSIKPRINRNNHIADDKVEETKQSPTSGFRCSKMYSPYLLQGISSKYHWVENPNIKPNSNQ